MTLFANPELSKKLELLSVEPQFDYWWLYDTSRFDQVICESIPHCENDHKHEEKEDGAMTLSKLLAILSYDEIKKLPLMLAKREEVANYNYHVSRAYHFSDILLPKNAMRIWPEDRKDRMDQLVHYREKCKVILHFVQEESLNNPIEINSWQSWLLSDIKSKLKEL